MDAPSTFAATQPLESPSSMSDDPSSPIFSPFQSVDSVDSSTSGSGEDSASCVAADARTPTRTRRYPAHLSHGSPPRAKNKPNPSHYESMEELLSAAGYTVTRVFTPETERAQKLDETQKDQGAGGIGTKFAEWISHILPTTTTGGTKATPTTAPDIVEDAGANPFLNTSDVLSIGNGQFPQTTRSLRTHLMTRALRGHPSVSRSRDDHQRTITRGSASGTPTLRHATSAPSLPRVPSGRRRALPSVWREPAEPAQPAQARTAWSGGFIVKNTEVQLKPRKGWFGTAPQPNSTVRVRSDSQPPRGSSNIHLRPPVIHRARSAPRPGRIHVPAPSPPVRPSPVVQQNVVVCRSVSTLGSSSSVQTRPSTKSKPMARSNLARRDSEVDREDEDEEEPAPSCPVLAPEQTLPDGLPPTPSRPVLIKQRSNGFLRRGKPSPAPSLDIDDEPDLASIIHAFRPPSAPPSPTRRQRSIRSLRALLRDPKFPDVPVVCVASPGTVSAGGAGRAVWLRG